MENELLKDLVVIFAVAVAMVLVLRRIGIPPIAGFIFAGVFVGPNVFGIVDDVHEVEVLAEVGLSRAVLADESGERIDGARRALRVRPEDAEATIGQDDHGQFVQLCFSLPSGSYATVLMGEVFKGGQT